MWTSSPSDSVSRRLLSIAREHTGLAGSEDPHHRTLPSDPLRGALTGPSGVCQTFSSDSREASGSTASCVGPEGPCKMLVATTTAAPCTTEAHLSVATSRKEGGTGRPVWVQRTDPLTGRKVYVHTISGNTSVVVPPELACNGGTVFSGIILGSGPTLPPGAGGTNEGATPSGAVGSSRSSAAIVAAAPHLTHSFTPFVPREKAARWQRPLGRPDEGAELAPRDSERGLLHWLSPSKWREGHLCDDVASWVPSSSSSSTAPPLLQNWENPAFGPSKERVWLVLLSVLCSDGVSECTLVRMRVRFGVTFSIGSVLGTFVHIQYSVFIMCL